MAIVVGALLGFAAPAQADHPTATPPGAEESLLRASETQTPGSEHAAAHAQQRALAGSGAPSAAGTQPAAAGNPAQDGRWGGAFEIPVHGIHAALLPTGKVMLWARPFATPDNEAVAWLWDPTKQLGDPARFKRVDPPLFTDPETGVRKPANIWCSGQSHMADGQLLVTGGNLASPSENPPRADYAGMKTVYTFNPFNETWTEQPKMGKGRWYPSQALLPDGRTLLMSGLDETGSGANNKQVELFSPPSARGGQGKITKIGDRGGAGQPPDGGLYPHLAVLPSGRTLMAGPQERDSWLLRAPGAGSGLSWTGLPETDRHRLWGSGVLRPGGTGGSTAFTLIGGSDFDSDQDPPGQPLGTGVRTSVTFDESKAAEGWTTAPPLTNGRSHHNTVLLPDKSMVTVGGGLGSSPAGPGIYGAGQWAATDKQRPVELMDPATGSWRLGAAQAESRAYHSTALLLPDGRVMSAGDDQNGGAAQDTAEIYEPPYLLKGLPRPVLDSAPATASYGASFDVTSSGPAPARAVLMAPGAVTHANDMSQRAVELALTRRTGGARLTAPARAALAPPGYYMLFLVSDQGVPSVARFVRLVTPKPKPAPVKPKPPSILPDRRGPSIAFSARRGLRGRTVKGRVSDPSGVKRMQVAVIRARHGRCRSWSPRHRGFGRASRRSCLRPAFISARLRRSGDGYVWTARLGARLRPGRYRVALRAVDSRGNVATASRRAARVTVR